ERVAARWLLAAIEAAWGEWPSPRRSSVEVNAIIPAVSPDAARELAREAVESFGCATIKVKVAGEGQSVTDDVARVAEVRAVLDALVPGRGRIRVDANGAWSVDDAVTAITMLDRAANGLEYVEQPCRSVEELAELRPRIGVRVAADELIRQARDPAAVVRAGRIDVVVVKVPPLGGVSAALATSLACGVPVVVSGAMDSAVGLGAGLALAAALPDSPLACGLGTGGLLAADVVDRPLRPTEGRLSVTRIEPDSRALAAATERMPGPRRDWWFRRLERAWISGANQYSGYWLPGVDR
ncbi:MAG: o-succinylbenzoate synthase, partial [Candidatus Nanopelagicales bacterium]|nr:o-succinylbenzoate synthase [Candidatus Nanopelagicales bacterium]